MSLVGTHGPCVRLPPLLKRSRFVAGESGLLPKISRTYPECRLEALSEIVHI